MTYYHPLSDELLGANDAYLQKQQDARLTVITNAQRAIFLEGRMSFQELWDLTRPPVTLLQFSKKLRRNTLPHNIKHLFE